LIQEAPRRFQYPFSSQKNHPLLRFTHISSSDIKPSSIICLSSRKDTNSKQPETVFRTTFPPPRLKNHPLSKLTGVYKALALPETSKIQQLLTFWTRNLFWKLTSICHTTLWANLSWKMPVFERRIFRSQRKKSVRSFQNTNFGPLKDKPRSKGHQTLSLLLQNDVWIMFLFTSSSRLSQHFPHKIQSKSERTRIVDQSFWTFLKKCEVKTNWRRLGQQASSFFKKLYLLSLKRHRCRLLLKKKKIQKHILSFLLHLLLLTLGKIDWKKNININKIQLIQNGAFFITLTPQRSFSLLTVLFLILEFFSTF